MIQSCEMPSLHSSRYPIFIQIFKRYIERKPFIAFLADFSRLLVQRNSGRIVLALLGRILSQKTREQSILFSLVGSYLNGTAEELTCGHLNFSNLTVCSVFKQQGHHSGIPKQKA